MAVNMDRWYEEMREVLKPIREYYDIDKVKPWAVYIWTKDNEEFFDGNVFDIGPQEIIMYNPNHKIPQEALPIIEKIQEKLREVN